MNGWILLGGAIISLTLSYTLIPDLLLHRLGIGSWKRQYTHGIALTFDDGPDSEYTPRILDILTQYGAPATFFLVGEKAAQYPELVKEIQARGHQIGVHCQVHRYAWFLGPRSTWKKWEEGIETVERLTGQTVTMIRPPWGTFNLSLWWWMKRRNKKAVLWSREGHDWKASTSPLKIVDRILKKIQEGSIIVLHDSGGEMGAPEQTLQALPILCRRLQEEIKRPLVKLELPNWSTNRLIVYRLWEKWEHLFERLNKVERISSTNCLRLSRSRYKGPHLYSKDARLLAKGGDFVAEIHLDNAQFLGTEIDRQKVGLRALRQVKGSLPELASYVVNHPDYQDIQVFLGLTLLNRGVKGLGFEVQEVPISLSTRAIGVLQRTIRRVYQPTGMLKNVKVEERNYPKLVWISRQELLKRWLQSP